MPTRRVLIPLSAIAWLILPMQKMRLLGLRKLWSGPCMWGCLAERETVFLIPPVLPAVLRSLRF